MLRQALALSLEGPPTYPYIHPQLESSSFFDSKSDHFGALPSEHVMVHLLRCVYTLYKKQYIPNETSYTTNGGVASSIFKPSISRPNKEFDNNAAYLLVLLLIHVTEARTQALDTLNQMKAHIFTPIIPEDDPASQMEESCHLE